MSGDEPASNITRERSSYGECKRTASQSLDVRLVPSDCVYSVCGEWWDLFGERHYYDAVIHAIAIVNLSSELITVESLTIDTIAEDRIFQKLVMGKEEIEDVAKPVAGRNLLGLRRFIDLLLWVDRVLPLEMRLMSSSELEPNTALVVPNIYLIFHMLPNALKVIIDAKYEDGAQIKAKETLNVIKYQPKVKYNFPLEGSWFMKGTPIAGFLDHHRFGTTNEFGVDLLRLGPDGSLFKNEGRQASDFHSYGEKVLAAADGKVVAVNGDSVQEWSRFNPIEGETIEQFRERQLRELREALERDPIEWFAGNYIVIKHQGGEYSAYLHLRENSVRMKTGDIVKRGQQIAEVGNTGDSWGAHLHFQVVDNPDPLRGRSLPFRFKNIEIELHEPGQFIRPVNY